MSRFWPNLLKIPIEGDFEFISNFTPQIQSLGQALVIGTIELMLRFVSTKLQYYLLPKFISLLEDAKFIREKNNLPLPKFFNDVIALLYSATSPTLAFKEFYEIAQASQFTYESYFQMTVCGVFSKNESILTEVLDEGIDRNCERVINEYASKLGIRIVLIGEYGKKAYSGQTQQEIVNLFLSYNDQGFGLLYPKEFYEVQNDEKFQSSRLFSEPFVFISPSLKSSSKKVIINNKKIRSTTPLLSARSTINFGKKSTYIPAGLIPRVPTENHTRNQLSFTAHGERSKSQIKHPDCYKVQVPIVNPRVLHNPIEESNNEEEKTLTLSCPDVSKQNSHFSRNKRLQKTTENNLVFHSKILNRPYDFKSSDANQKTERLTEKLEITKEINPALLSSFETQQSKISQVGKINEKSDLIFDQNSQIKNSQSQFIKPPLHRKVDMPNLQQLTQPKYEPINPSFNNYSSQLNSFTSSMLALKPQNSQNLQKTLVCIICNRSSNIEEFNKIVCKREDNCNICLSCRKLSPVTCNNCKREYKRSEVDDLSVL